MLTYNWHKVESVNLPEAVITQLKKHNIEWNEPIMILIGEVWKRVSILVNIKDLCSVNNEKL